MRKKDIPSLSSIRFIILIILTTSAILLSGCSGSYPNPIPCGDTNQLITAIKIANGTPATHDIIELDAGCVYKIETNFDNSNATGRIGLPSITSPITIRGHGAAIVRSSEPKTPKFRLFLVGPAGELILEELTLQNGYADDPKLPTDVRRNSGGAIRNTNILSLYLVNIQNNNANGVAGGIFNEGVLKMELSSISGCEHDGNTWTMGGAVAIHNDYSYATATIKKSAIYGNGLVGGSSNVITNNETSTMTIENTTISGNGGRALNNDGDLDLIFCTIVGHGSGIWSVWYGIPTVDMIGNIFQNTHDCDIDASVLHTNMNNMDSDGTCGVAYTVPGPAQGLLPLANNGGITLTHALSPSSPAIDAVMGVASRVCPIVDDQRSVSRPQIARCDIGAYEFDGEIDPESPPPQPEEPLSTSETEIPERPADTPTSTPMPNRCDLFDSKNAKLTMLDIPYGETTLDIIVEYPHPIPGLEEEIPGDARPWEYSAKLGDVLAEKASFQGYSGMIHFTFELTKNYFGYAFPLEVWVNFCDKKIYFHRAVTVFEPEKPEIPPTPTETPIACVSTLNKADCVASGGTYDTRKKTCNCP